MQRVSKLLLTNNNELTRWLRDSQWLGVGKVRKEWDVTEKL